MMMKIALIASFIALILALSDAFHIEVSRSTFSRPKIAMNYEKMLEQARQRKLQGSRPTPAPQTTSKPSQNVAALKTQQPSINTPTDGVPFSDEIYDHLKFVISKLTSKIRADASLSESEVVRFEQSVEAIIADATGDPISSVRTQSTSSLPSSSPTSTIIPVPSSTSEDSDKPDDDSFKAFYGLGSTWNVPGMEDMTKEEYYEALNRRNAEIRAARRAQMAKPMHMDDFLKSLSRPRPQPQ